MYENWLATAGSAVKLKKVTDKARSAQWNLSQTYRLAWPSSSKVKGIYLNQE